MLVRRALRASVLATLVVAGVGLFAGLVRLLPWIFAPEVPLEVSLPFAWALAASASETGFLVGVPIGFALAAARSIEDGEVRALAALGVSPLRLTLSVALGGIAIASACLLTSLGWGSDSPGRFASDLVQKGQDSCARASVPKSASVPLVHVTWLCFPGSAPLVTGPLPGSHGAAWFTAHGLKLSDDLGTATLRDLTVVSKPVEKQLRVTLRVGEGVVRGLPVWGRGVKLSLLERSALLFVTLLALALAGLGVTVSSGLSQRALALVQGGVPALVALVLLHRLDATSLAAGYHWLVPISGLSVAAALGWILPRVARLKW
jgi:hypothetical protein